MEQIPETKELNLPSGEHVITVRNYLTGEDKRAYRRILLKLSIENKSATIEGLEESEAESLKLIVLSMDGNAENILERVVKLGLEDYDFVMEAVAESIAGLNKKKALKSEKSTSLSSEDLQ